ncbi:MAG: YkgJ family cysteine cluster protein [Rhizobacter sp.]|nr:YkgJ family cysteine cluster protein [Chlorobiales bacterium]
METTAFKSCLNNLPVCKGSCCKNGVWVDQVEAAEIERQVLLRDDLKDLHGRVLFDPKETEEDFDYHISGKGIGTMLQSPEGPCIFLDAEYKCRIYQFRPTFCSDYPFMHPLETSSQPIILDTMFEGDPKCIYTTLLAATIKSRDEAAEESGTIPN